MPDRQGELVEERLGPRQRRPAASAGGNAPGSRHRRSSESETATRRRPQRWGWTRKSLAPHWESYTSMPVRMGHGGGERTAEVVSNRLAAGRPCPAASRAPRARPRSGAGPGRRLQRAESHPGGWRGPNPRSPHNRGSPEGLEKALADGLRLPDVLGQAQDLEAPPAGCPWSFERTAEVASVLPSSTKRKRPWRHASAKARKASGDSRPASL